MSPLLPKLNDKNEICCQALKMFIRRIHCVTEGDFPENTWYFSSPYCHAAEVQPGTSGKTSMTHKVNNWKMWFRLRSISPPGRSSPQLTAIPGPHTSTQVQEKVKVSRRFPSQSPEPDKSGSSTYITVFSSEQLSRHLAWYPSSFPSSFCLLNSQIH